MHSTGCHNLATSLGLVYTSAVTHGVDPPPSPRLLNHGPPSPLVPDCALCSICSSPNVLNLGPQFTKDARRHKNRKQFWVKAFKNYIQIMPMLIFYFNIKLTLDMI